MREHEALAEIEKLKAQIITQKKVIKRCRGDKSLIAAAVQYLRELETRLDARQSDLATLKVSRRMGQPATCIS